MSAKLVLFGIVAISIVNLVFCCPELTGKDRQIKPARMVGRSGGHNKLSMCCRKRKAKQRSMVRTKLHKPQATKSPSTSKPALNTQAVPSRQVNMKKFNVLKKVSKQFGASNLLNSNNPCTTWMACPVHHAPQFKAWLHNLPSCPCHFSPVSLYKNNTVYDQLQKKFFNWKVVDAKRGKLSIFKPCAAYCIQQQFDLLSSLPSVQQCCYDKNFRLITRGSGAGTPILVAPEINYSLHSEVDLKPFMLCQGDWTRYQSIRSPNNGYNCTKNPKQAEFMEQVKRARDY